jgi:hypothetical protein
MLPPRADKGDGAAWSQPCRSGRNASVPGARNYKTSTGIPSVDWKGRARLKFWFELAGAVVGSGVMESHRDLLLEIETLLGEDDNDAALGRILLRHKHSFLGLLQYKVRSAWVMCELQNGAEGQQSGFAGLITKVVAVSLISGSLRHLRLMLPPFALTPLRPFLNRSLYWAIFFEIGGVLLTLGEVAGVVHHLGNNLGFNLGSCAAPSCVISPSRRVELLLLLFCRQITRSRGNRCSPGGPSHTREGKFSWMKTLM